MKKYRERGKTLSGDSVLAGYNTRGVSNRSEYDGAVCATPTAGAGGVLPGVVFSIADTMGQTVNNKCVFFTAACWDGRSQCAMIAGAFPGGCRQVGSASAMTAAAAVEAAGGTPQREFKPLRQREASPRTRL